MALNGITLQKDLFAKLSLKQNTLLRILISVVYTFIASLVMTGYIWAFREDWQVSGGQLALARRNVKRRESRRNDRKLLEVNDERPLFRREVEMETQI